MENAARSRAKDVQLALWLPLAFLAVTAALLAVVVGVTTLSPFQRIALGCALASPAIAISLAAYWTKIDRRQSTSVLPIVVASIGGALLVAAALVAAMLVDGDPYPTAGDYFVVGEFVGVPAGIFSVAVGLDLPRTQQWRTRAGILLTWLATWALLSLAAGLAMWGS